MKNAFIDRLKGIIKIKISGKNVNRFLNKLMNSKIELLEIDYSKHNEVIIKVKAEEYPKILKIKTIYDIEVIDTYGIIKIKKIFMINRFFIGLFVLGIFLLIVLSSMIFEIEIIHLDKDIRNIILFELNERDIKKYSFKKSYPELEKIKKEIILNNKDKIEWLEIEKIGVKYIIRVEERKIAEQPVPEEKRHIIAKKAAIIKKVEAESGEIVRNVNDYVRPGDVVISGEIKLYDEVKNIVSAKGRVYGEVWYQTKVSYPLAKKIEIETLNTKKVLSLKILNKKIDLFNFKPFTHKKSNEKVIFKNPLLPISLVIDYQKEIKVIEEVNTIDTAITKALEMGNKKMKDNLNENEYIIKQKSLKVDVKSSKIEVDIFFAIYEDITDYRKIEIMPNIEE